MGHGALYGHRRIPSLHRQMFFQMRTLSQVLGGRFLRDLAGRAMVPCDSSLPIHEHLGDHDLWLYSKGGQHEEVHVGTVVKHTWICDADSDVSALELRSGKC